MTSLFLLTFLILTSLLMKNIYNYILLFNFMLFFQLLLGPAVRVLGYNHIDDVLLTLVISVYMITSSTFLLMYLNFFNLKSLEQTVNLQFISNSLYYRVIAVYFILILIFLLELRSELNSFNLIEIRLFYHEQRSNSYMPLLFAAIGILGPVLALISADRKKFMLCLLLLLSLLLIGKKAPFFTFLVMYVFILRPKFKIKTAFIIISLASGLIFLQQQQSTADLSPIKILSGYFDYHLNLIDVLQKIYARSCCFGIFDGNIAVSKLWYLIPRFVYENKPIVYSHLLIHSEFYPNELLVGYTRGIVANVSSAFADFGFLGLIVYGAVNAFLFALFISAFSKEKNPALKYLYLLIVFNPISPLLYFLGVVILCVRRVFTRTIIQ